MGLRDYILSSARAVKSCVASLCAVLTRTRWNQMILVCWNPKQISHHVCSSTALQCNISIRQLDSAVQCNTKTISLIGDWRRFRNIFVKKAQLKSDTTTRLFHVDVSQSCQVLGLWCGLYPRIDMNSHPKITRYEQEIRREHESPRSKLSHSQFFMPEFGLRITQRRGSAPPRAAA